MEGTTFEADEIYQNALEKVRPIPIPTIRRDDGPGTLRVKRRGLGTYDNDRPPIIHLVSR